MRCEICCQPAMKTPHHVYSRGAYGKAALLEVNELPLCVDHHNEVHRIGRDTFAARYGLQKRFRNAREAVRRERQHRLHS